MLEKIKERITDWFIENRAYITLGILMILVLSIIGFFLIGAVSHFRITSEMIFGMRGMIWRVNRHLIYQPGQTILYGMKLSLILTSIVIFMNVVTSVKSMITLKTQFPLFMNYLGLGGVLEDGKGTFGKASWLKENELKKLIERGIFSHSDGIIIGALKERKQAITDIIYKTTGDERRNRHTIVIGGSGSGKSFCFSLVNSIIAAREKRSLLLTDPKGELYKKLSKFLKYCGMKVMKLNLLCPKKSDKFNPFVYITSELDAFLFTKVILDNTSIDMDMEGAGGDPFWEKGETNLLKALVLYVWEYELDRNKNLPTIYDYLVMPLTSYDKIFENIPDSKACKKCYNIFMDGDERVQQGIKVGLASRLQIFQLDDIREMMSTNEIDIFALKREHAALFVLTPDTHNTFDYIQSLLFNFVFIKLTALEDAKDDTCNYSELDIIADEFANIGRIPKFDDLITTLRSRNIALMPMIQDTDQLKRLYPKSYNTIIGNCDVKLFLGGSNPDTNKEISERIGKQTIKTIAKTKEKFKLFSSRFSVSEQQRMLIEACELEQLGDNEMIAMIRGQKPLKLFKYGWVNLPEYAKIKDMETHAREYLPDEFIPVKTYSM